MNSPDTESPCQHVMVAVDGTPASEPAVRAAAGRVREHPDRHVLLFHALPTIPPELLEYGGTGDDDEDRRGLQKLHEQRVAWIQEKREEAQPMFDRLSTVLREEGVADEQIELLYDAPNPECTVAREVLEAARKRGVRTILVGHHAFPWHRELFHRHVGAELHDRAETENVLVIGGSTAE